MRTASCLRHSSDPRRPNSLCSTVYVKLTTPYPKAQAATCTKAWRCERKKKGLLADVLEPQLADVVQLRGFAISGRAGVEAAVDDLVAAGHRDGLVGLRVAERVRVEIVNRLAVAGDGQLVGEIAGRAVGGCAQHADLANAGVVPGTTVVAPQPDRVVDGRGRVLGVGAIAVEVQRVQHVTKNTQRVVVRPVVGQLAAGGVILLLVAGQVVVGVVGVARAGGSDSERVDQLHVGGLLGVELLLQPQLVGLESAGADVGVVDLDLLVRNGMQRGAVASGKPLLHMHMLQEGLGVDVVAVDETGEQQADDQADQHADGVGRNGLQPRVSAKRGVGLVRRVGRGGGRRGLLGRDGRGQIDLVDDRDLGQWPEQLVHRRGKLHLHLQIALWLQLDFRPIPELDDDLACHCRFPFNLAV